MAESSRETFEQMAARIAREPEHMEVEVTPIAIDLSPGGVLNRLRDVAEQAHERGEMPAEQFKQVVQAADALKTTLGRIDSRILMRAAPGAPRSR